MLEESNNSKLLNKLDDDVVTIQSYKIALKTKAGKDVLKDLKGRYMTTDHSGIVENNQLAMAFEAGQRNVVQRIINIQECNEKEYRNQMEELHERHSNGPEYDNL